MKKKNYINTKVYNYYHMHYYKLFWGVVEGCFSLIIVSPTSKTLPLPRHFFVVRRVSPKWESTVYTP